MGERPSKAWRWLTRPFAAGKEIQIVLDRRQGERRQRIEPVAADRRREDRRQPISSDLGEVTCFLGEGTGFKGDLTFRGALRLDGRAAGDVIRGEVLIIGESGQVEAEIQVEILQVSGEVHGNVAAKRWVELLESSRVTGTIRTPRLTIWKGAVFNGTCEMPPAQRHGVTVSAPQEMQGPQPSA